MLVPVQGEYFALEGLSDLMNTVRIVRRSLNPRLELEGVLLTMFDGRTNLALQVAEEVKRYFPGKVYATVIPRNVRLSEAPSHGKPITAYDRTSRGAEAYTALAAEFLQEAGRPLCLMHYPFGKETSFHGIQASPRAWAGASAPCWATKR